MSFKIQRLSNNCLIPQNLFAKRNSQVSLNFNEISSKQQIFYLKTVPIKSAKIQSFYQQKSFILDGVLSLINLIVIILVIMKNFKQIQQTNNCIDNGQVRQIQNIDNCIDDEQLKQNKMSQTLLLLTFSVLAVIFNIVKGICKIHIDQQTTMSQHQQIDYVSYIPQITIKSIIYFIHPSNLLQEYYISQTEYLPLNTLLSCIVYSRFVITIVYLLKLTRFYGLRVKRVIELYHGNSESLHLFFSLKSFLKSNTLYSPFIIYTILFTTLPFFLISIQNKFYSSNQQFSIIQAYLQSVYHIIITMTTVGYGDLRNQFNIQRFIIIIIIIIGSLSSSFLTLTFLNWFKLNEQQQKALKTIKILSIKQQINQNQKQKIQTFLQTAYIYKKSIMNQQTIYSKIKQKPKIQKNQTQFYQQCIRFKAMLPYLKDQYYKSTIRQLNHKSDTFKQLCEKNMLIFSQSLKILIERSLLTNNLLQFFLMRKRNIKNSAKSFYQSPPKHNSEFNDSQASYKTRRRVDDSIDLYNIKMKIVNQIQNKKNLHSQQNKLIVNKGVNDQTQRSINQKNSIFKPDNKNKFFKKKVQIQIQKRKVQITI